MCIRDRYMGEYSLISEITRLSTSFPVPMWSLYPTTIYQQPYVYAFPMPMFKVETLECVPEQPECLVTQQPLNVKLPSKKATAKFKHKLLCRPQRFINPYKIFRLPQDIYFPAINESTGDFFAPSYLCLLYTSPSPRDQA
eukprot:TRINITY_DN11966_c0_g1_i2.p1 TRINITY_DN11966_c0_g1~~TRINITY_DN11966_c0_g1_i2.p1  ORF type:complete len:140 (-),score=13.82 TRINITY_DN11966_c0_g1_i2:44-463(-)